MTDPRITKEMIEAGQLLHYKPITADELDSYLQGARPAEQELAVRVPVHVLARAVAALRERPAEEAKREADALAAVIVRAKANLAGREHVEDDDDIRAVLDGIQDALDAPAVSLAEHDAQVLEAFAAELRERYPEDVFIKPTAEDYAKLHAALMKQGLVVDRFSADLMRRAAAQADAEAARLREGSTEQ